MQTERARVGSIAGFDRPVGDAFLFGVVARDAKFLGGFFLLREQVSASAPQVFRKRVPRGRTLRGAAGERVPVRRTVHARAAEVHDVRPERRLRAVAAPRALGGIVGRAPEAGADAAGVQLVAAVRDAVAPDAPAEVRVGHARAGERRVRGVAAHAAVVHHARAVQHAGAIQAVGVERVARGIAAHPARVVAVQAVRHAVAPHARLGVPAAHAALVVHLQVVLRRAQEPQGQVRGVEAHQRDVRAGRAGARQEHRRDRRAHQAQEGPGGGSPGRARPRTRAPARAAARAPRGPAGPTAHRQSQQRPLRLLSAPSKAQLFSTCSLASALESAPNAATNAEDGRVAERGKSRTPESGKIVRRRSLKFPCSGGKKSEILTPFSLVIRRAQSPVEPRGALSGLRASENIALRCARGRPFHRHASRVSAR